MRRIAVSLILAASLSLASCGAVTGEPPGSVSDPAPVTGTVETIAVKTGQAATVAVLGYKSAAEAVLVGVRAGAIKGQLAADIRDVNAKCLKVLGLLQTATNAAEKAQHAASLLSLVSELDSLTPK